MAVFLYKALAADASNARGMIVADSPRQARDELRTRGLTIHELVERPAAAPRTPHRRTSGRLAGRGPGFVRELATLRGVGMPLTEALSLIASQRETGRRAAAFSAVVLSLRDRV